jgi:DNA-binding transcriptional MerR regulator
MDVGQYTVGEMARRLARSGTPEEIAILTRQLRNWTATGLLTPIGEKHEGTGKHRRYDNVELLKAALLDVLARNFRVDITGLQSFVRLYEQQRWFFATILTAEARVREEYPLWVGFRDGQVGQFGFGPAPDIRSELKRHEVVLALDVVPIARRVFA